jgi:hypothetical protein
MSTATTAVLDPRPSNVPAGFDAIVQISAALMHRTLAANLAHLNLNPLSARVPYRSELVSAGLRALIQPLVGPLDAVTAGGEPQLEVQLSNPTPQMLNWPAVFDPPVGGTSVAARTVIPQHKMVTLLWGVTVNLFKPSPPPPVVSPGTSGGGAGTTGGTGGGHGPRGAADVFGGLPVLVASDAQILDMPPPLPAGARTLLARGTATMTVPIQLLVNAPFYQFRLAVNFETAQPTYASSEPVMLEFLPTELASSLLNQALAPLRSQYALAMSPMVSLAGTLTPSQLTQAQLPALHVNDIVIQDPRGQVVALCVSLGNDSHGAFSMVTSFLAGHDFAYYVSDRVYGPVMKGLWRANAIHTPIVGDVMVEMPVSEGSQQTGMGRARVQVKLADALDDAGLIPSVDGALGDPMRIVSKQTVNLLALWDPQGHQISDLGGLAEPTVAPFAIALQMFDKPAAAPLDHTIQPPLSTVLKVLFSPLYFPVIERYGVTTVSGFTSSALRAVVTQWSLPRVTVNDAAVVTGTMAQL